MSDFDNVESVIENSHTFKEKLKIDDNAFAALSFEENLRKVLLHDIAGEAEEIAVLVEDIFKAETGEEFTTKVGEEKAAEIGKVIGANLVKELEDKFGKEVADEVGVKIACEFAAKIGAAIAAESGAECAKAGAATAASAGGNTANKIGAKVAKMFAPELADLAAGMVADSKWVTETIFPAPVLVSFLIPATAPLLIPATAPLWVILSAGVGTSLLTQWGLERYFSDGEDGDIEFIPNCINTSLDILAFRLFYFFAPLGIKVAMADSTSAKIELKFIHDYFQNEWGFSTEFTREALFNIERNVDQFDIVELTKHLIEFHKDNPDCDYGDMTKELKKFLFGVIRSDGKIDPGELDIVSAIIAEQELQLRDFWNKFLH